MFEYCSCDSRFKSEVGGIRVNEPLTLFIGGEGGEATLVLTKEGEGHCPVGYKMGRTRGGFTVTVNITSEGLYFYTFVIDGVSYGRNEMYELVEGGQSFLQLVYDGQFKGLSGLVYQIMPDRFFIGGQVRKKVGGTYVSDLFKTPSHKPNEKGEYNREFFGGNLQGITEKLDYIKSLGVTYIYLNPIFESPSSHKYDTADYEKVDGGLGDKSDLIELIAEAQRRGIGIILDGVFSHTGDDSKYFNKYGNYDAVGAYQSKDSEYYGWYKFEEYPDKYRSWWGITTLPEVEETSPAYMDYMLGENGIVARWESLGISGWRLDVADELPDEFLYALRKRSRGVLIGEVWENAALKVAYGKRRKYFSGKQLDGVTGYPVRGAIIDFALGGDNTSLRRTVRELINDYPHSAVSMNLLSTHDTVRILTALSRDKAPESKDDRAKHEISDVGDAIKRLKLASAIQYMLPGTPCLYYGDEAGSTGYEDPFCRKFYPWGRENGELLEHYRRLGKIRSDYKDILSGSAMECSPSKDIFMLRRSDGKRSLTLIANMSGSELPLSSKDLLTDKSVVYSGEAAVMAE